MNERLEFLVKKVILLILLGVVAVAAAGRGETPAALFVKHGKGNKEIRNGWFFNV